MLQLSNLCHCVQHPWKLTSWDFWSSRNNRKPLSKLETCFPKMLWGISEMVNATAFKPSAIVFSIPENLLVKISGALEWTKSHFPSKNVFWENAEGYLRNGECYSFQIFAIVFSTPENLLVGISGALWMNRKPLSQQKCVLRKCCGVSQKWWMLQLSNLCHCVQHPWKLTSTDFWSSMNNRKPLSQQKCVLRKCCGVSQKWWMLALSNLCHCVQHPWKLTSKDFWSSMESHFPRRVLKLWGITF